MLDDYSNKGLWRPRRQTLPLGYKYNMLYILFQSLLSKKRGLSRICKRIKKQSVDYYCNLQTVFCCFFSGQQRFQRR